MRLDNSRPRAGRLLDVLVIALSLFVFAGLAVYHYRRLDRTQIDLAKAKELADRKLAQPADTSHDWPHWRGPNFDGVSSETDILTDWPKGGPKVLWETPVGEGFASVSVSKGRAFTIFQQGESEVVACWDAETGKELWRFTYACDYKNSYGNGPRSTPSVDGDLVYTVGATGIMHCLKAFTDKQAGEVVWSKNLLEEFAAPTSTWGVAFSPLVDGERVFIMPGGPDGNALAALDKRTGALLWKKYDDRASYSSPIPATMHGERQILFFTGGRLLSVRPDTGEQLWEYPWPTDNQCNIATPIIVEDYVYLSTFYGRGCAMLKIDKTNDGWAAGLVYKNLRMRNHLSTSLRYQDSIYGFDDSLLTCMDFRTGKVQWKERGFDKGSLIAFKDHLIVYGANGSLALVEANPKEYGEKSRFTFSAQGKSCWSVPVLANGRLYVRDQERLVCLDVRAN